MRGSSNSIAAPDAPRIAAAAQALARGGLVVYPTETLYALGADATNLHALERLVAVKGRDPGKPIAVLIGDLPMLAGLVAEIPPLAATLMRRFWPGPLTLVLRARAEVSPLLTGPRGGIGVRLSSHPLATALAQSLGRPLTAPSANPAGRPAPTRIAQARAYFGAQIDAYVDGGELRGEPASTVLDVRTGLEVIREGAIAVDQVRACATE